MYTPDSWVVIRITRPNKDHLDKVLAGWYGGFAGSNKWKMNSGIEKTVETEEYYDFIGYSGSTYRCYKGAERFSGLTSNIYATLAEQFEGTETSIELMDYSKKDNNADQD